MQDESVSAVQAPRDAIAAGVLPPFTVGDLGVEQDKAALGGGGVTPAARGIHDSDPQRLPNLRGGDAAKEAARSVGVGLFFFHT